MNFYLKVKNFKKFLIENSSLRLMTSHQMGSLKNKQLFENVENLLKLIR